jgi:hypothetical protein
VHRTSHLQTKAQRKRCSQRLRIRRQRVPTKYGEGDIDEGLTEEPQGCLAMDSPEKDPKKELEA